MHCTLGDRVAYSINKNHIIVLQYSYFDLNDDDMCGSIIIIASQESVWNKCGPSLHSVCTGTGST